MSRYAESTSVPADRSRAEIEKTLTRYGADQFLYGWDAECAVIRFRMNKRHVAFRLPLPDKDDPEIARTPGGRRQRSGEALLAAWEQAQRQRWRALALVVKAKLEAVESGITSFEDEFMAHIILPSGETVGQWMGPQIEESYRSGVMPTTLLALPPAGAKP